MLQDIKESSPFQLLIPLTIRSARIILMWIFFFRIERLWRDVWNAVSSIYYSVLHRLEEDGFLNPADLIHVFCAQYVFLPRIQNDLNTFQNGWNSHSLRTEGNRTPDQLWEMGMRQAPFSQPDNPEVNFYSVAVYLNLHKTPSPTLTHGALLYDHPWTQLFSCAFFYSIPPVFC